MEEGLDGPDVRMVMFQGGRAGNQGGEETDTYGQHDLQSSSYPRASAIGSGMRLFQGS